MDRRTALGRIGSAAAIVALGGCAGSPEGTPTGTGNATETTDGTGSAGRETDAPTDTATGSTPGDADSPTGTETDSPTGTETDASTPEGTESPDGGPNRYEFEGELSGWYGRAPADIEGEDDPTITLRPGETYEITWVNGDGSAHRFAIEDGRGNKLVQSDKSSEDGATRSFTFEATDQMATYYCTFHASSMKGDVRSGD